MPSFTCDGNEDAHEVDFEVYCGKCGRGICDHADVCKTYRRSMNRVDVKPCERCIAELEDTIKELRELLSVKEDKIEDLKSEVSCERSN